MNSIMPTTGQLMVHPRPATAPNGAVRDGARLDAARPAAAQLDDAELRQVCAQLEGVFLEQLMKAMRETVPDGGLTDGGAGEEIFSSLLDGHLSNTAAAQMERGLGAALYRQLRGPGAASVELHGAAEMRGPEGTGVPGGAGR
jgi:flagellar protein FlgJ